MNPSHFMFFFCILGPSKSPEVGLFFPRSETSLQFGGYISQPGKKNSTFRGFAGSKNAKKKTYNGLFLYANRASFLVCSDGYGLSYEKYRNFCFMAHTADFSMRFWTIDFCPKGARSQAVQVRSPIRDVRRVR